jgi:integrase/recombinase XerD
MTPDKERDDMSEHSSGSEPLVAENLDLHLTRFIAGLANAGYAGKTLRDKERLVAPFIRWARDKRVAANALDETCVDAFLRCPSRRRDGHRTALRQFVEHLRVAEVVPRRCEEASPAETLLHRYFDHLRDARGLSPHSLAAYSPFVHSFVLAQKLPETAETMDALAVRSHVLDQCRDRTVSSVKLQAAALRSFLRFCFLNGTTARDLSTAVPPVGRWQAAAASPFLTGEEVEQVIAAADRSTTRGRRDFAILLLLARLGLRASEVLTLEFDDVRWEAGEIVVRGKGGLHDRLPLLADVGEALALYLRMARGSSRSRRVFLRLIAPRVGLTQPTDVSKIARTAMRRAGLLPSGRAGAHVFRHSLASRMIQRGASLPEISQVLRHRSTITTQLYAKLDLDGLRGVARPWPDSEVSR